MPLERDAAETSSPAGSKSSRAPFEYNNNIIGNSKGGGGETFVLLRKIGSGFMATTLSVYYYKGIPMV